MRATRLLHLLALAVSLPFSRGQAHNLDVYSPEITEPNSKSVWIIGHCYNVTWNTSNAPPQITDTEGIIYLGQNNTILLDNPGALASNFSILAGSTEVEVPEVPPGEYHVVLFGDSGNDSENFPIITRRG